MAEYQMPKHGEFCWNELATTDSAAARTFYTELFGWKLKQSEVGGDGYSEIMVGEKCVGGMHAGCAEQGGVPSHWMAYVSVDDVDASARRVEELGGKVCVPPTDIPGVGRFSVINDPTGATLSIITLSGAQS